MTKLILILEVISIIVLSGVFYFTNVYEVKINDYSKPQLQQLNINDSEIANFISQYGQYQLDAKISKYISKLTFQKKLQQLFIVSVKDKNISDELSTKLDKFSPAGIFFEKSAIGLSYHLAQNIETLCRNCILKPFFVVSQEGGDYASITDDNSRAGAYYISTNDTEQVSYFYGKGRGEKLNSIGLNMNFGPLLNLQYPNSYAYKRELTIDPQKTSRLTKEIARGQNDTNVISVGKYFPGDGISNKDPDQSIVTIDKTFDKLVSEDIKVYDLTRDQIPAILLSNATYSAIENVPASVSAKWNDYIRNELKYDGVLITGDLNAKSMSTLSDKYETAIKSQKDLIFTTESMENVQKYIDELTSKFSSDKAFNAIVDKSLMRVYKLKLKFKILEINDFKI